MGAEAASPFLRVLLHDTSELLCQHAGGDGLVVGQVVLLRQFASLG